MHDFPIHGKQSIPDTLLREPELLAHGIATIHDGTPDEERQLSAVAPDKDGTAFRVDARGANANEHAKQQQQQSGGLLAATAESVREERDSRSGVVSQRTTWRHFERRRRLQVQRGRLRRQRQERSQRQRKIEEHQVRPVRFPHLDQGAVLDPPEDPHQGRQAAVLPQVQVRDPVQAPPGVPPEQALGFEAVQVQDVQLHLRQQLHADLAHEIALGRTPLPLRRLPLHHQVLPLAEDSPEEALARPGQAHTARRHRGRHRHLREETRSQDEEEQVRRLGGGTEPAGPRISSSSPEPAPVSAAPVHVPVPGELLGGPGEPHVHPATTGVHGSPVANIFTHEMREPARSQRHVVNSSGRRGGISSRRSRGRSKRRGTRSHSESRLGGTESVSNSIDSFGCGDAEIRERRGGRVRGPGFASPRPPGQEQTEGAFVQAEPHHRQSLRAR